MNAPPLTPLAAAVLHVPAPERALVVGCGDGEAVFFLAREFPSARVRGVDRSEDLIRAARDRVGLDPEGRVAFKVGGPRSLPYPERMFDLVVQEGASPSPREVARVLRPGGHLVHVDAPGRRRPRVGSGRVARGLRKRGFEPVWSEAIAGRDARVARLRPD